MGMSLVVVLKIFSYALKLLRVEQDIKKEVK